MPLKLSRRASRDLDEIYNYGLSRWGEDQAEAYLRSFWRATEFIVEFPLAARLRDEVEPAIRAFGFKRHLILYDVEGARVVVQRVAHARSDWVNDAR